MTQPLVQGIERATFGAVPAGEVDEWLHRHLHARLGVDLSEVLFRSGRVSAVFGVRLDDGSDVVVKVQRGHLDQDRVASLAAAVEAQRLLAAAGFPCPVPVDGPAETDGLTATVETLRDSGLPGNAHQGPIRTAIAASLAHQVHLLGALPEAVRAGLRHPPAWAQYQHGPWPAPHDPIFDFTTTPTEHAWIDSVAATAAGVLTRPDARAGQRVVGHGDWYCGNLRFTTGDTGQVRVSASWDWDSLVTETEPVIAGMAAASFTDSSTSGDQAPTPAEAGAFLADYDAHRARPFTLDEQVTAAAALTWTLAYNARCQIDLTAWGIDLPDGPVLDALATDSDTYLHLRW